MKIRPQLAGPGVVASALAFGARDPHLTRQFEHCHGTADGVPSVVVFLIGTARHGETVARKLPCLPADGWRSGCPLGRRDHDGMYRGAVANDKNACDRTR
jgi:hypothetical protein